jgi:IS30 family transposase
MKRLQAPEEFWARLRAGVSVTDACRAVGVSCSTGYQWIHRAGGPRAVGIPARRRGRPWGGRHGPGVRDGFLAGLRRGLSVNAASLAVGVSHDTGRVWLVEAGGVRPPVQIPELEATVDAGQGRLTWVDRCRIQELAAAGYRPARIAALLGRHRSTIGRELARGRPRAGSGRYRAVAAQNRVDRNRRRAGRPVKLAAGGALWAEVVQRLNRRHSPEQIARRLRIDFPDEPEMWVSHETIYQALYVQGAGSLRHELAVHKALRTGRRSRRPRSKLPPRPKRSWIGAAVITARPAQAADRAVPGHWEGDLVVGGDLRSALITLFERTSRYTLIARITIHDTETVTDRLTQMAERLPESLWRSLTWDQGVEMADHARFTVTTGCPVFFCDPHSPWQRPTNENGNGLIRDFFPKGTDFTQVTDTAVAEVEHLLNTRPRKVLGFATPAETLDKFLLDVAPTT